MIQQEVKLMNVLNINLNADSEINALVSSIHRE